MTQNITMQEGVLAPEVYGNNSAILKNNYSISIDYDNENEILKNQAYQDSNIHFSKEPLENAATEETADSEFTNETLQKSAGSNIPAWMISGLGAAAALAGLGGGGSSASGKAPDSVKATEVDVEQSTTLPVHSVQPSNQSVSRPGRESLPEQKVVSDTVIGEKTTETVEANKAKSDTAVNAPANTVTTPNVPVQAEQAAKPAPTVEPAENQSATEQAAAESKAESATVKETVETGTSSPVPSQPVIPVVEVPVQPEQPVKVPVQPDLAENDDFDTVETKFAGQDSPLAPVVVPPYSAETTEPDQNSEYTPVALLSGGELFAQANLPANAVYVVVESLQDAKLAADNPALQYIVVSDGVHHAVFEKGHTNGMLKQTFGGSVWGADFTEYVPVIAFANSLQGDVTAAFQEAAKMASKLKLGVEFPQDAAYTISDNVFIANGISYLNGNNVVLTAENMAAGTNIFRLMRGTGDIEISNFTLDLNDQAGVAGIVASNPQNVNIHDMHFVNVAFRAINMYTSTGDIKNVVIENNIISAVAGDSSNKGVAYGIAIGNGMDIPKKYQGTHNPLWQQYLEEGTVAGNPNVASGIKVVNNQIDGGYYGISFSGITQSEISGNAITNNMRNISLQNNASDNTISNNYLSNSISSSVHIAYNSDGNTVTGNTIISERATGQGMLQTYQGSDNNKFINNSIEVLHKSGPGWALYAATDSSNTTFSGNIVDSAVTRSLIGAEAVWDSNSANGDTSAYMPKALTDPYASQSLITYGGGKGDLSHIVADDNILLPGSLYRPVVYIGADRSTGYKGNEKIIGNVTDMSFSGNIVFGNEYSALIKTHESGATIKSLVSENNTLLEHGINHYTGTAGNDIFYVDHSGDRITDSNLNDSDWVYSTVSYTLASGLENLRLIGEAALIGSGNSGDNLIVGNAYDNILNGMGGDDILIGGYGSDILTGGAGADLFVFDAPVNGQVDYITDFNLSEDKIGLSQVVFGQLNGDDWFTSATDDITVDTRVIQDGNKLYYDADGAGQYFSPVQFAELNTAQALNMQNFEII